MKISEKAFDAAVQQAIDRIPEVLREHLANLLISVQQQPSAEMLSELGLPETETLFGLYWGVPLDERSVVDPPLYPDTIFIFQEPLEAACTTLEELVEEIEITVAHEIAHFVGMSEEEIERLGYA